MTKKTSNNKWTSTPPKRATTTAHTNTLHTQKSTLQKHYSDAARKRMASAAKKAFERTSVHQRIQNKIAREREQEQLPLTDEPWLTLRQCAERTGFAYLTVQRWTHKENGLRYRRFGRTIRVPISELERFSGGVSTRPWGTYAMASSGP